MLYPLCFLSPCFRLSPWAFILSLTCANISPMSFVQVKVVATNLNAAEEALEAYQREKQQRLNELLVVIPLKLHQVTPRSVTPRSVTPGSGQKQCHTKNFPEKDLWLTSGVPLPLLGRPVYRTMSPTLLTHSDFWLRRNTKTRMPSYGPQSPQSSCKNEMAGSWDVGPCTQVTSHPSLISCAPVSGSCISMSLIREVQTGQKYSLLHFFPFPFISTVYLN